MTDVNKKRKRDEEGEVKAQCSETKKRHTTHDDKNNININLKIQSRLPSQLSCKYSHDKNDNKSENVVGKEEDGSLGDQKLLLNQKSLNSFIRRSTDISELFGLVKKCRNKKSLEVCLPPLWDSLVELRINRQLAINFIKLNKKHQESDSRPPHDSNNKNSSPNNPTLIISSPKQSSQLSDRENEWIANTFDTVVDQLELTVRKGPKGIASLSLFYLLKGIKVESIIRKSQKSSQQKHVPFPIRLLDRFVNNLFRVNYSNETLFGDLLHELVGAGVILGYADLKYYLLVSLQNFINEELTDNVEIMNNENDNSKNGTLETAKVKNDITHVETIDGGEGSGVVKEQQIKSLNASKLASRVLAFLQIFPTPEAQGNDDDDNSSDHLKGQRLWCVGIAKEKCFDARSYKDEYCSAWLSFLRLDFSKFHLPPATFQEILTFLPTNVMPFLVSPLSLATFFISAFQSTNDLSTSVQALSGLFYLLVKNKLGEPQLISGAGCNYYDRLFGLLQPRVLSMNHRVRFLRLLRVSLQSKMLSTDMRVSFIKKLITVALLCPLNGSLWLLSVAHSLLQSGGYSFSPLIHCRQSSKEMTAGTTNEKGDPEVHENAAQKEGLDEDDGLVVPFSERIMIWDNPSYYLQNNNKNKNNDNTNINDSNRASALKKLSLWEIELIKRSWHPSLSQMAKLFDSDIFKPTATKLDPDEFISISTCDLLFMEVKSLLKKATRDTRSIPLAFSLSPSFALSTRCS